MKGGKIVTLNAIGEEVPSGDPSAVKRFDTNTYKELPLGGRRRKTKKAKASRRKTRRGGMPPVAERGALGKALASIKYPGPLGAQLQQMGIPTTEMKKMFAALPKRA